MSLFIAVFVGVLVVIGLIVYYIQQSQVVVIKSRASKISVRKDKE